MHPETKKINTKNMPYLTLTENLKLPWFSRLLRHPARKRSVSILGQIHTHVYLLTYLPRTHTGH